MRKESTPNLMCFFRFLTKFNSKNFLKSFILPIFAENLSYAANRKT